jgi:hypothetical protein
MIKRLISLLLFSNVIPGFAQLPDQPCDTLLLADQSTLIIRLDSVSRTHVHFKHCLDTLDEPQQYPMEDILGLNKYRVPPVVNAVDGRKVNPNTATINPTPDPTWIFYEKLTKKKRRLSYGDEITVHYRENHQKKKYTGYFTLLDDQFLTIKKATLDPITIPKQNITKITLNQQSGWLYQLLGGGAFIISAIIAFVAVVVALLSLSISTASGGGTNSPEIGCTSSGCALSGILALVGLTFGIVGSLPKTLPKPFSNAWEVYQESNPPESQRHFNEP